MSNERHSAAVNLDLLAFLQDATSGIAARCVDINTRTGASVVQLPTSWTFPGAHYKRQKELPAVVTRFVRSSVVARSTAYQKYQYIFAVVLAVGVKHTKHKPETEEQMRERLEWMTREVFDEESAWHGETLGGRVVDAFLGDIDTDVIPLSEWNEERAVFCGGLLRVTRNEAQTHP